MTPFFALLQRDEDWSTYVIFFIFVVIPLAARLFRWLLVRLGIVKEEDARARPQDPREELRRAREQRRAAEDEGEDLWRRLARGEVIEPPPTAPVPVPARVEAASPAPAPREVSLEREEEPEPLSVLGEVLEPAEAPEASLESEAEPVPLGALAGPAAEATEPRAPSRPAFRLARGDLGRAIVLAEILGPPVSERALRA
jgi:hypothetical protein